MPYPLLITPDHPALPGHFPGNPIVPGVVILQRIIDLASKEGHCVTGVANMKFSAPLHAGESCSIHFDTKGTRLQFSLLREQEIVAQGSLDTASLMP